MMIGLYVRTRVLVMGVSTGHVDVVGHRFVVVTVLCRHWRHTEGHRRGSEALERHRQQRHPDDQDFQDGFHTSILAYAKVSAIPSAGKLRTLRCRIVRTCHFCMC